MSVGGCRTRFGLAHVDGDHRHVFGDRDDRHVDRAGDALGGAMARAGFARGHARIGHEMHVGPRDAAGVGGEDDGAVHLGQLLESLRAVGRVEQEPARADAEHIGTVAHDDQRALVALDDAIETVAQRHARRDLPQHVENLGRQSLGHLPSLLGLTRRSERMRRHTPAEADSVDGLANGGHPDRSDRPRQRRRVLGHDDALDAQPQTFADALLVMARPAQLTAETRPRRRPRACRATPHPPRPTRPRGRPRDRRRARWRRRRRRRARRRHARRVARRPARAAPRAGSRAGRRRHPAPTAGRCWSAATSACTSTRNGRCPSTMGTRTDPAMSAARSARNSRLGIGHGDQAVLLHLEHAELVGAAEAMLDRAQHPQRVVPVAFERQHGVDEVFEHARPGQRAVFGDVAHQHQRHIARLCDRGAVDARSGAPARPSPAVDDNCGSADGLDGVDDDERRRHLVDVLCDAADVALGHRPHVVVQRLGAGGARLELVQRLFGRHVEHPLAARGVARRRSATAASTCRCRARRRGATPNPATKPPPSTRSISGRPVGTATKRALSTAAIDCGRVRRRRMRQTADGGRGLDLFDERVPLAAARCTGRPTGDCPARTGGT